MTALLNDPSLAPAGVSAILGRASALEAKRNVNLRLAQILRDVYFKIVWRQFESWAAFSGHALTIGGGKLESPSVPRAMSDTDGLRLWIQSWVSATSNRMRLSDNEVDALVGWAIKRHAEERDEDA